MELKRNFEIPNGSNGGGERVFQIMLAPKVETNTYCESDVNKFINELGVMEPNDVIVNLGKEKCLDCIIRTVKFWIQQTSSPPVDSLNLVLKTTASISKVEFYFERTKQTLISLMDLVKRHIESNDTDGSIELGYLNLIESLVEHDSGLNWIIETDLWSDIVFRSLTNTQYRTVSKLIERTGQIDTNLCVKILKQITDPLTDVVQYFTLETINNMLYDSLRPTIICLLEILEYLLERLNADVFDILRTLKISEACNTLASVSKDESFSLEMNKIIIILSLYEMMNFFQGIKIVNHDTAALSGIWRVIKLENDKGHLRTVIKICLSARKYWQFVKTKMPKYFLKDKLIKIENQLLILQMMPLFIADFKFIGFRYGNAKTYEEVIIFDFFTKILRECSEPMIHLAYLIKDKVLEVPLFELETLSLECLLEGNSLCSDQNEEMIGLIYQGLVICFKYYLIYVDNRLPQCQIGREEQQFVDKLLEAILFYTENFNLSWRDSIGSVLVTTLALVFLGHDIWCSQLVLKGLKLLNLAIFKNMSPNMTLLLDVTTNSCLKQIGPIIYWKCSSNDVVIRSAAIDVLYTMCYNANTNYPFFKPILTEAGLPELIYSSIGDQNCHIRITAIKCLQEIILMEEIGQTLIERGILESMLNVLYAEPETEVRKEAALFVTKLYETYDISEKDINKTYSIMAYVALKEIDPGIKETAVIFWRRVIRKNLMDKGMMDGMFPTKIFSKENRRIVLMTEVEVRNRLLKGLNELYFTGCLAVFLKVMQNDRTPMAARNCAIEVLGKYSGLLRKYKITPEIVEKNIKYSNLRPILNEILTGRFVKNTEATNFNVGNEQNSQIKVSQESGFELFQEKVPTIKEFLEAIYDKFFESNDTLSVEQPEHEANDYREENIVDY